METVDYKHLAELLVSSSMSEAERIAWNKAIPSLTPELLAELVKILEQEQIDLQALQDKYTALAKNIFK
ncbi:MAG: hypothetical protein WC802_05375 [Patescibacteria group bacterium]|jgi:hypothetical protein